MERVHELLKEADSHPTAHIIAAALPTILAAGIRAWQDTTFAEALSTEERVTAVLNAMASTALRHTRNASPHKD